MRANVHWITSNVGNCDRESMADVSTRYTSCFFCHNEPFAHVAPDTDLRCNTCVSSGLMFLGVFGTLAP